MGGKSSTDVISTLNKGGVMVTYDNESSLPVIAPTNNFIFDDVQLRGFCCARWRKENINTEQYHQMYDELLQYVKDGKLWTPPYKAVPFNLFKEAFQYTISSNSYFDHKYYFVSQ